ncbi:MAG: glycine cleavage system aminomethyltransferase GcvT [Flavobacteriales bacterium]
MKKTALNNIHEELGAKMVEFAGYKMPVQYSGVKDEHFAVRNSIGIFDVSHMGEFILKGDKSKELLQWISTNDAEKLFPGKAQYSCMPNTEGGIIDDLIIYMLEEDKYMLVVNAANIDKDWDWINKQNENIGAELENVSDQMSLIAIQGPKAKEAVQPLSSVELDSIKFYHFEKGDFAGVDDVIISATGYTGEKGLEIYIRNEYAEKIWNAVMEKGEKYNIKPAGLASRDTLRLEAGLCLYGNDIDETTSPIEARLGWITKFTKDFVSKDIFMGQKENGINKKLMGFEMLERGIPRKDHTILDKNGNEIGKATSGTMSPTLNKGIGLGYVNIDHAEPGTDIKIAIRNKEIPARIVKPPFLKK